MGIADAIRAEAVKRGLLSVEHFSEGEKSIAVQKILQAVAQMGRDFGHVDHWLHRWAQEAFVRSVRDRGDAGAQPRLVVPDIRYLSEARYLLRLGGWVYLVDPGERRNKHRGGLLDHETERQFGSILDELNGSPRFYRVFNDGTLSAFEDDMMGVYQRWLAWAGGAQR